MAVNLARSSGRSLLNARSALASSAQFRCALAAPGQVQHGQVMQQTRNAGMGGVLEGSQAPYIYPEETGGQVPWDRDYWNPLPYRDPKFKSKWPSHHHNNITRVTRMIPDLVDLDAEDRARHAKEALYVKQVQEQEAADRAANPDKWAQADAARVALKQSLAASLKIPRSPSILNAEQMERYKKFWDEKGQPLPGTELPESRLLKR